MRRNLRYTCLTIPNKLRCDIRISLEVGKGEYTSLTSSGDESTSISLFPSIILSIIRPVEVDETGRRIKAPFNVNDSLSMNRYNLPIFVNNLITIRKDMEKPELYTYQGKRLEINEELAKKIRNPFVVGRMTVELSAVVITQPDETRVEGIKLKFNNEQSSVLLTLNELDSLIFNLKSVDIDNIAMLMYLNYFTKPGHPDTFNASNIDTSSNVDILPKEKDYDEI